MKSLGPVISAPVDIAKKGSKQWPIIHADGSCQAGDGFGKVTLAGERKPLPPECINETRVEIERLLAGLNRFVIAPRTKEKHGTIAMGASRHGIQRKRSHRFLKRLIVAAHAS